jgi:3-hydroxyisobutyrate dehydrogenase
MTNSALDAVQGQRIGVIGLGVLGTIFARHLEQAGARLAVHDVRAEQEDPFRAKHNIIADSAKALAETSDIIVLSLPNPAAVDAVFDGPNGLLQANLRGRLIIDTSTVAPETNERFAQRVAELGGTYIDAPVSGAEPMQGGADGAEAASLTFMVGGPAEAFARARPVFQVLGKFWFHLGVAGAGTRVKLISNLCSGLYTLVAAEAFALGAAIGVAPETLLDVFRRTDAKSYAMTDYLLPRALSGRLEPGFSVNLQLKDHRLAADMAATLGADAPMNDLAVRLFAQASSRGRGELDVSSVVAGVIKRSKESV